MTEITDELTATAETLRQCDCNDQSQPFGNCLRHSFGDRDADALIGLIDGMVEEQERLTQIPRAQSFVDHMDNFVLPLLVFYVNSLLGK